MSFAREIVCLANSRKPNGHCIAGKEKLSDGSWQWLRPVGTTPGREITDYDMKFQDNSLPRTLDVIEIEFSKKDNHPYQAENLVIDPEQYWKKTGKANLIDLDRLADNPATLWNNGYHSTAGTNDRVPAELLQTQRQSLYLIRPSKMKITVSAEAARFNDPRRKVRAHFTYKGTAYALKMTDPKVEDYFLAKPDGEHPVAHASYLTVSLAELYNGYAYKVVAAVF